MLLLLMLLLLSLFAGVMLLMLRVGRVENVRSASLVLFVRELKMMLLAFRWS